MPPLPVVEVFSKPGCHLCEDAKALLQTLQASQPFLLREVNITLDATLHAQYGEAVPVVFINGRKVCKYRVDVAQFVRRLQRARHDQPATWWQRFWQRGNA
jgi:glutaredoxin